MRTRSADPINQEVPGQVAGHVNPRVLTTPRQPLCSDQTRSNPDKKQIMKGNTMAENPNVDDLKAPLLAALGAADLALATVNELISNLRQRAQLTRTGTCTRALVTG